MRDQGGSVRIRDTEKNGATSDKQLVSQLERLCKI